MTHTNSKLLDMRDCAQPQFVAINRSIARLEIGLQPLWFRPFFKLGVVRRKLGYGNPTRLWEYPWAVSNAQLQAGMRVLDVGSEGSAFPAYLASKGCQTCSADPSLQHGMAYFGPRHRLARFLGIWTAWGVPPTACRASARSVMYVPYSVQRLQWDDGHFDRVFCLSVMEHIPESEWAGSMQEMSRVLRSRGRLLLTLDMSTSSADARQYEKLLHTSSSRLVGSVEYAVPISADDKRRRHPGHTHETVGLTFEKVPSGNQEA